MGFDTAFPERAKSHAKPLISKAHSDSMTAIKTMALRTLRSIRKIKSDKTKVLILSEDEICHFTPTPDLHKVFHVEETAEWPQRAH